MGEDNRSGLGVALNGYGLTVRDAEGPRRQVLPWRDVVDLVDLAEETGYDAVFVPEIAAREAFATLTGFSASTSSIALGTGVIRIDRRDAHTTALAASTVHELSAWRLVLGLGSSGLLDGTRSFVADDRALLAGDAVAEGDGFVRLDGVDVRRARPPIYLAALGPRMTELGGEVADGVLLNWCPPERVERARAEIARGAARAGRDPGEVTVAVYVRACLAHEEAQALPALREAVGQYAAMPRYERQFESLGLGEAARAAAAAVAAGRPDEVPAELVDAACVRGSREEALARLSEYREAGADLVVVYPVPAREAVSSIIGTLLAVAPDPSVEH
jgi:alkanesulfonate monooxygenase SsuD/methylene tetrahydromethanopterin reductase-like flavin-dependent oxidoreductase (luciferase family)